MKTAISFLIVLFITTLLPLNAAAQEPQFGGKYLPPMDSMSLGDEVRKIVTYAGKGCEQVTKAMGLLQWQPGQVFPDSFMTHARRLANYGIIAEHHFREASRLIGELRTNVTARGYEEKADSQ